jgi:hypothetical protein
MNATYVGEATRQQISVRGAVLVILNAPEGISQEDVRRRLFAAGFKIGEDAEILSESEWPEEVRAQVNAP